MANFHLTTKHVTRSSGRSAVAAAAYRAGEQLTNERDGKGHNYSNRDGVLHTEIFLPRDSKADWALDREKLWNEAEKTEIRKDARTAREIEFSLPHELNFEQQTALTRELGEHLANLYGTAVDVAIHAPAKDGDQRNYHVHALMATRTVGPDGLGNKTMFERSDKWLRSQNLPTAKQQLKEIRDVGEEIINHHLAKAGLDVRVDCRSHKDRGLKIKPTRHVGVHATAMQRKGLDVHRQRLSDSEKKFNRELVQHEPGDIFKILTDEKSVFDRRDIARALHRYTDLKGQDFQNLFVKIMADSELLELVPDSPDSPAQYTTQAVYEKEQDLMWWADRLASRQHKMAQKHVDRAIKKQDRALQAAIGANVTQEQRGAVKHLTDDHRLSILVGYAGTGKSTVLGMAADAWTAQGYRVIGTALSGKAAEGLEQASGIKSQTLASLEMEFKNGRKLTENDVLVVDEAGMLTNRQLERLVLIGENHGAKVIFVGDSEQLQSMGAGGAFRSLSEPLGAYRLTEIRRQKVDWQAQASVDFATQNTKKALQTYMDLGAIKFQAGRLVGSVIKDYVADFKSQPDEVRLAIAHTKKEVRLLNTGIRSKLQAEGHLSTKGERVYRTNEGMKSFAPGDRVALGANSRKLGLKNGMFGTVEKCGKHRMRIILDGSNRKVVIPLNNYRAVAHGYACTVHKSQGATVDASYVVANKKMDRHMTYVAMTRHRHSTKMYASSSDFPRFEDFKSAMSRGNAKKSTLDFLNDFGSRRGVETSPNSDFTSELKTYGSWQKHQDNPSPVYAALDYYGMAMEERCWLGRHGVPEDEIPENKLNIALKMLEKAQSGLREKVLDAVENYGQPLERLFIWPSSNEERVEWIKEAVDFRQQRQNAMSGKHPPRATESYPEPKPKPKPEPVYEPVPTFRM